MYIIRRKRKITTVIGCFEKVQLKVGVLPPARISLGDIGNLKFDKCLITHE